MSEFVPMPHDPHGLNAGRAMTMQARRRRRRWWRRLTRAARVTAYPNDKRP